MTMTQGITIAFALGVAAVGRSEPVLTTPAQLDARIDAAEAAFQLGGPGAADPGFIARLARDHLLRAGLHPTGQERLGDEDRRRTVELAVDALKAVPAMAALLEDGMEGLADSEVPTPPVPKGLLHLAAGGWCSLIPSLGVFSRYSAAKRCKKLLERSVAYDRTPVMGEPLRAYARFLLEAPRLVGGDAKASLPVAEEALASGPDYGPNRLVHAEALHRKDGDDAAYKKRLEEILNLPDDGIPDRILEQRRAKEIAAERLKGK